MPDMIDAFKKAGLDMPEQPGQGKQGKPAVTVPQDYVEKAEQVILNLQIRLGRKYQQFTTSKLRNILSMVSDIYNNILHEQGNVLSDRTKDQIEYLKVRLVYESGREPDVIKPFVIEANLIEIIGGIGDSRERFIAFSRYMEALVAYHRFHGGKD